MDTCAHALHGSKLPFNVCKKSGNCNPEANIIHIMTIKVSKGLEFPVVKSLTWGQPCICA